MEQTRRVCVIGIVGRYVIQSCRIYLASLEMDRRPDGGVSVHTFRSLRSPKLDG